jgi:diguanylate cyclase (GGDEF)-like protein
MMNVSSARDSAASAEASIRVLLVEDMEIEGELTRRQLLASGIAHVMHRVETENAMRAALSSFKPTIILSDFTLPTFDGLSALEIARECAPDIPFLFVSGTIGEERAIEALRRGAVDYVLKTNLARLGPAVKRALEEANAKLVRREQEAHIARLTGVLRMLSGINGVVVRIHDRNELLREACRLAVGVGGYPAALAALKHSRTQSLDPVAWSGMEHAEAVKLCECIAKKSAEERFANLTDPHGERALIQVAASECAPPSRQTSTASSAGAAGAALPMIWLPLVVDKTLMGVLAVCTRERHAVVEEESRMLREVAANLSFALQYLQQDNRVRLLSYFDVLTGLAKRSLFCDRVNRLVRRFAAHAGGFAVTVVDVQNLSAVNDTFGRHAGDLLLQLLADRLKRHFRDTDRLAHLAGGTFAVVQPASGEPQMCVASLTSQLNELLGEPFGVEGKDVPISVRSGIAICPQDGREGEVLLQKAEAALWAAKASGGRSSHYSAEQHSARLARIALERKLRIALERRQFELHYQPKVTVKTRRIEGVEALIRWNDPEVGLVSPAEFLPILEQSGLIVEVGDWVIERAAADCRDWQQLGLPAVRIAVNISPLQLQLPDFVGRFLKHTQAWATPEAGLDVEITEGALIDESSIAVGKLKLLRAAGVGIAIDDFGTGYSSLSRLAYLPIDTLKIDRSFISRMLTDAHGRKLISIIIDIARVFGMQIVAEGVETQAQLDALWQLGCDQSQGYLHSKPVTSEQFVQLLQHGNGRYILPKDPPRSAEPHSHSSRAG